MARTTFGILWASLGVVFTQVLLAQPLFFRQTKDFNYWLLLLAVLSGVCFYSSWVYFRSTKTWHKNQKP